MIDDCKSFGCSSVDVEDVREEVKEDKIQPWKWGEHLRFLSPKRSFQCRWENVKHPCLLQQIFWPKLVGFGHKLSPGFSCCLEVMPQLLERDRSK